MNPKIQLYQLTRGGNSIGIGRIAGVTTSAGPIEGGETVRVDVQTIEHLWGPSVPPERHFTFERPGNRVAQLKFPDPVWGGIDLRDGTKILIAAPESGPAATYVGEIADANDPVLQAVRSVLNQERNTRDPQQALQRHLEWLRSRNPVETLFAGESLANEAAAVSGKEPEIVSAYVQAFAAEPDEYVKISLGGWLWDRIYPLAGRAGQVQIVNATLDAAGSELAPIRGLALDRLSEADPELFREHGIQPSATAARLLEQRRASEQDPGVRKRLEEIVAAIRK